MKQNLKELRRKTDTSIILVGDSNTLFSILDRTTRQKIKNKIDDLNNIKQQHPKDIYGTL